MRTIGVVTVGRSDYGIYLPILRKIRLTPELQLHLIVSGAHLSEEGGMTIKSIKDDGFPIGDCVEMPLSDDSEESIARAMGEGMKKFAWVYAHRHLDALLVLGDRYEMHAAVCAAVPFSLPIIHIHGGEVTEGAMDERFRHSITKMSHVHFVSTEIYKKRLLNMGEEPWRVSVSGAPGLDNLREIDWLELSHLEDFFGMSLTPPPLLVTFHPVTLELENTQFYITELLTALDSVDRPILFTYPNLDMGHRIITGEIEQFVMEHPRSRFITNLGTQVYFSLMRFAGAMVGNSSSGIIEAASFHLPVVNIGSRQRGRVRSRNVIDVPCNNVAVAKAIDQALDSQFRSKLEDLINPYGDGFASERIVETMCNTPFDRRLLQKHFYDVSEREGA